MLGRAGPVELLSTLPLDDQPPERSGLIIGTQPKFLPTGAAHPGLTSEAGAAAPPPRWLFEHAHLFGPERIVTSPRSPAGAAGAGAATGEILAADRTCRTSPGSSPPPSPVRGCFWALFV